MTVELRSEHPRGGPAVRRLRGRALRFLLALEREASVISILVVDDVAIREINRTWRHKDRATDVLSFPGAVREGVPFLGDVVISLDTAERVAAERGVSVGEELDRYLAHGLLHLLGHDHERPRDARRMAKAEDALVGEGMVSSSSLPPSGARKRRSRGRGVEQEATRKAAAPRRAAGALPRAEVAREKVGKVGIRARRKRHA